MALFRTIAPKIYSPVFSSFTVTQNSSKALDALFFNQNNYFSVQNNEVKVLSFLSFVTEEILKVSFWHIKTWSVTIFQKDIVAKEDRNSSEWII